MATAPPAGLRAGASGRVRRWPVEGAGCAGSGQDRVDGAAGPRLVRHGAAGSASPRRRLRTPSAPASVAEHGPRRRGVDASSRRRCDRAALSGSSERPQEPRASLVAPLEGDAGEPDDGDRVPRVGRRDLPIQAPRPGRSPTDRARSASAARAGARVIADRRRRAHARSLHRPAPGAASVGAVVERRVGDHPLEQPVEDPPELAAPAPARARPSGRRRRPPGRAGRGPRSASSCAGDARPELVEPAGVGRHARSRRCPLRAARNSSSSASLPDLAR